MSSALLYRLSGTALVFGALLSIVYHVVAPGCRGAPGRPTARPPAAATS
jgi:hypothetical protein